MPEQPQVSRISVSLRICYSAVPAQFPYDPRMPGGRAIAPAVDQGDSLVEDFEIGTPELELASVALGVRLQVVRVFSDNNCEDLFRARVNRILRTVRRHARWLLTRRLRRPEPGLQACA